MTDGKDYQKSGFTFGQVRTVTQQMGGQDPLAQPFETVCFFQKLFLLLLCALFGRTIFRPFFFTLIEFALVIAPKDKEEEENKKG